MIRLLIVDDHRLFLDSLKKTLDEEPNIQVVGVASSALKGLTILEKKPVDVVLMDIFLGEEEMDGREAASYIYEHFPQVKVLVLSMVHKGRYIDQMLKLNVAGYVLKQTPIEDLLKAIHAVHKGETYFSAEVMKAHMDFVRLSHAEGPFIQLTPREQEILQLLVEGNSTAQIGDQLCIGEAGVETHRRNLRKKLKVKNTAALIREAILKDLVDIDKYQ